LYLLNIGAKSALELNVMADGGDFGGCVVALKMSK
jgi:hypothetical protein